MSLYDRPRDIEYHDIYVAEREKIPNTASP